MGRDDKYMHEVKREILQGPALKFDLEPGGDYMRPGNTPAESAFQLITCGYDMLIELSRSGFPTMSGRTRRRAGRWIRQNLRFHALDAVQLLAHAMPTLMGKLNGRLGDDVADSGDAVPVEEHAKLKQTVEDFFPLNSPMAAQMGLPTALAGRLQFALREFAVLEDGKVREEVENGAEVGTEYSRALLRDEDPSGDPELVEIQRRWARDYFINIVAVNAARISLGQQDAKLVEDQFINIAVTPDRKHSSFRARELAFWIAGSESYRRYALLDSVRQPEGSGQQQ